MPYVCAFPKFPCLVKMLCSILAKPMNEDGVMSAGCVCIWDAKILLSNMG